MGQKARTAMDSLIQGPSGANRPIFAFERPTALPASAIPADQLMLSAPAEKLDAAHWPVRGDLAHIRLAGRCFVPHYAVPMPHVVIAAGATLRIVGRADADAMDQLSGGTLFNVLDMAGGWTWGQVGEDGLVGYVPLDTLAAQ
jgi:hypothetical protein